jgi:phosphoglycolate phosphatase-like HAD superfamily hydrolase
VFDVDGVLADVRHRLHHVETRPKNWPAFFAAADADPPLAAGITLVHQHQEAGDTVVYLTGRNESHRAQTLSWLSRHGLPTGRLLMRPERDFRPARQYKAEMVRELSTTGEVTLVVDDDVAVVATLHADGWPVLQADWMHATGPEQQALFQAQDTEGRT